MHTIQQPAAFPSWQPPSSSRESSPATELSEWEWTTMYTVVAICMFILGASAIDFDPTKWAQYAIAALLAASTVATITIRVIAKFWREVRALRAELKGKVAEAINESEIPTTPEEKYAERRATASVLKAELIKPTLAVDLITASSAQQQQTASTEPPQPR